MVQLLSTTDLEGMLAEAAELASVHKNIVVKIPCTAEGIKAIKALFITPHLSTTGLAF